MKGPKYRVRCWEYPFVWVQYVRMTEFKGRRDSPRLAAIIQVRYRRREDFALEYARDISLGGVFIATEDPLSEGEAVEIQLFLPELKQPVALFGTVVRTVRTKAKGLSGMGIAFEELDEFTRATLLGYLREMESDRETVVDRRGRSVRYDQVLEVHYASVSDFLVDYSENISKNGIFVKTENPADADSIVPMKLYLPNGDVLEITGKVVHALPPTLAGELQRPAGMGIEFLHFHGSSQERLWAYIESLNQGA